MVHKLKTMLQTFNILSTFTSIKSHLYLETLVIEITIQGNVK